jgi:hypothetical protein
MAEARERKDGTPRDRDEDDIETDYSSCSDYSSDSSSDSSHSKHHSSKDDRERRGSKSETSGRTDTVSSMSIERHFHQTAGKEWQMVAKHNILSKEMVNPANHHDSRMRLLATLFTNCGDIEHLENRTRLFETLVPGDIDMLQFALDALKKSSHGLESVNLIDMRVNLSEIARLINLSVLNKKAQKNDRISASKHLEEASLIFVSYVGKFDPSTQSQMTQSSIMIKAILALKTQPLKEALEKDHRLRRTVTTKFCSV